MHSTLCCSCRPHSEPLFDDREQSASSSSSASASIDSRSRLYTGTKRRMTLSPTTKRGDDGVVDIPVDVYADDENSIWVTLADGGVTALLRFDGDTLEIRKTKIPTKNKSKSKVDVGSGITGVLYSIPKVQILKVDHKTEGAYSDDFGASFSVPTSTSSSPKPIHPSSSSSSKSSPDPSPSLQGTPSVIVISALVSKRAPLPPHPKTSKGGKSVPARIGGELKLVTMKVEVRKESEGRARDWAMNVMKAAYGGNSPNRRVLLLVNPIGGKGNARTLVKNEALPVLYAAGCRVEVVETTHNRHAEEFVRDLGESELEEYDVIATASGDGLIHEVINGLAVRSNAKKALRIPIAPIPTGSANGMCINLFGPQETFNISLACLNVIKGSRMPLDLVSLTQGDGGGDGGDSSDYNTRFSFMSLAVGLMCDVDLGTEHLRWMGDARFVYGFLRGIIWNSPMKCRISMKVVNADKGLMIKRVKESRHSRYSTSPISSPGHGNPDPCGVPSKAKENLDESSVDESLPPIRELVPDDEWIVLESGTKYGGGQKDTLGVQEGAVTKKGSWKDGEGILYIYAGTMPYVARDLMQFPVSMPGEGVVDIVVQTLVPRAVLAGSITGGDQGKQFYLDCQHYYKATAYVVESLNDDGLSSIDGEALPFKKLSVQVHPRLATTMSLFGGWARNDFGV